MTTPANVGGPAQRQRRKLDRYELIAEIASGGMGTVLLARLEGAGGFQRFFAIKMMHPHLVEDSQFVAMLLDEARVAARIHHPNVVATVDICVSPVGYYLVMDYVDGFTLTHVLETPALTQQNRLRISNRILLDAMAGLFCVNVGYGRTELADVAAAQMRALPYYPHTAMNEPAARLAQRVNGLMGGDNHVYFVASGSEAGVEDVRDWIEGALTSAGRRR